MKRYYPAIILGCVILGIVIFYGYTKGFHIADTFPIPPTPPTPPEPPVP